MDELGTAVVMDQVVAFETAMRAHADAERAAFDVRYHKSSRVHWGVKAPLVDKVVRSFARRLSEQEISGLAEQLWRSGVWDCMIAATRLLAHRRIPPTPRLWRQVLSSMKDLDGWALEDNLARVAWKCLLDDPKRLDDVEPWTNHKDFWVRRAALIFTLPWAKTPGKDPERMLGWAEKYADDPEWFIQKAIGWWLRTLGARDPARVVEFLDANWHTLRAVARKEGSRRLPQHYAAKITGLTLTPRHG